MSLGPAMQESRGRLHHPDVNHTGCALKRLHRAIQEAPADQPGIERLVMRLARENGWAIERIEGELSKLGHTIRHETVRNTLRHHNIPHGRWLAQQARQIIWELTDRDAAIRFLIRDNDKKFTAAFDTVFRSEEIDVIPTPVRAPNANAPKKRWIRSVRGECLDNVYDES